MSNEKDYYFERFSSTYVMNMSFTALLLYTQVDVKGLTEDREKAKAYFESLGVQNTNQLFIAAFCLRGDDLLELMLREGCEFETSEAKKNTEPKMLAELTKAIEAIQTSYTRRYIKPADVKCEYTEEPENIENDLL